jgi:hypothetical protein
MQTLRHASLAHVQAHFVVAWIESPDVGSPPTLRARRLENDGTPIDPVLTFAQGAYVTAIRVTAMGGTAAIAWADLGPDLLARVRVSDWTLLAPQPIALQTSRGIGFSTNVASAFDGEHLLNVANTEPGGTPLAVRLQRVTADGAVLDVPPVVVSAPSASHSYDLALSASPGRRTLLAYTRFDPVLGSQRLHFRWLGTPPPPPPVDAAPPVDAPAPPVDAPTPPVDAPAPPVDAPVQPPEDAPVIDAGLPVDAGMATDAREPDASTPPDTTPTDGTGDTSTTPADARLDGRDGAGDGGDAARDASGDGGGDDEEIVCDCDLGGRPGRPGGGSMLTMLVLALIGGRRTLGRQRQQAR